MHKTFAIALIFNPFLLFGQVLDSVSLKTVDSLVQESRTLTNNGDFEQALSVNAIAEKIALEKLGRESAAYGSTCHNHGRTLQISGALPEAEQWYLEALQIREKVLGKVHPDYAASLNNLAGLYLNLANYPKAEALFLESKAIKESVLGKQHKDYAATLYNLGLLNYLMGNYRKAEPYYLEAKSIREKVLGKTHPDYLATLNNLAALYKEMGNYSQSEALYLELKLLREQVLGKDHPDYARVLSSLATLYSSMNQYERSEPLFLEAKVIWEKLDQQDDPDYTGTLNNLAVLYVETGNYEKAEALYLENIALRAKILGKEDPEYAWSLNNLANLYQLIGNMNKAESLYLEAQKIREKVIGKEHPDYAAGLASLANLYNDTGDYEKAEPLYLEASAIDERILGKEHPDYATCLYNLGNLYLNKGNYDKAEPYYLEAKNLREKITGKEHSFYAWSLHSLALLYWYKGRYDLAEPLLLEAQSIREKVLGKAHYDYSVGLDNLVKLYWSMGKNEAAVRYLLEADIAEKNLLVKGATHFSSHELAAYSHKFESSLSRDFSFALTHKGMAASCYDNILFYKGFLLNTAAQLNQLAVSNPKYRDQFNLLKSYERRLGAEYAKPLAEQKEVPDLEEKTNNLEKELTRSIAGLGEALRQVGWQAVQQKLKPGEAAIEFVHYQWINPKPTDSVMYAALVLTPGAKEPLFIPLFEEKQLDKLLQKPGNSPVETLNTLYNATTEPSLYGLIWKPLEQALGGIRTIYFSPSGRLHRLNPGAMAVPPQSPEKETAVVLAERFQLIELGSTRQLLMPSRTKTETPSALLYGGIQYEPDTMALSKANKELTTDAMATRSGTAFTQTDTTLRAGNWNYLKWTDVEVSITEALLSDARFQPLVRRGFDASEESIKSIGNGTSSPRILHIATHGFFFPDPKSNAQSRSSKINAEPVFKISDSPMIRSGLVLAGANYAWKHGKPFRPGMEDGILTAYEISQMNLRNTELVVLSACETGLGDLEGNEGVYGLQRAFKIAGAKYLIMSLWQVPDFQTQELMTTFYSRWIEDNMTVPDAFQSAQKAMREKYKDPFLWAGFVLVE